MRLFNLVIAIGLIGVLSAAAQSEPEPASDPLTLGPESAMEACMHQASIGTKSEQACIGVMIDHCPENIGTTVDILGCIEPELRYWDARLNAVYDDLIAAYEAQDAFMDDDRPITGLMRTTQLHWISWRDAKCGFEYQKYRGGTMGRISGAYCQMEETARRVFELQDLLAEAAM